MLSNETVVFVDGSPKKVCFYFNDKYYFEEIGKSTNNEAEYKAVIAALHALQMRGISGHIIIYSDSQLIVNQLIGKYKIKNNRLLSLWQMVKRLEKSFASVKYKWIPREKNYAGRALEEQVKRKSPKRRKDRSKYKWLKVVYGRIDDVEAKLRKLDFLLTLLEHRISVLEKTIGIKRPQTLNKTDNKNKKERDDA